MGQYVTNFYLQLGFDCNGYYPKELGKDLILPLNAWRPNPIKIVDIKPLTEIVSMLSAHGKGVKEFLNREDQKEFWDVISPYELKADAIKNLAWDVQPYGEAFPDSIKVFDIIVRQGVDRFGTVVKDMSYVMTKSDIPENARTEILRAIYLAALFKAFEEAKQRSRLPLADLQNLSLNISGEAAKVGGVLDKDTPCEYSISGSNKKDIKKIEDIIAKLLPRGFFKLNLSNMGTGNVVLPAEVTENVPSGGFFIEERGHKLNPGFKAELQMYLEKNLSEKEYMGDCRTTSRAVRGYLEKSALFKDMGKDGKICFIGSTHINFRTPENSKIIGSQWIEHYMTYIKHGRNYYAIDATAPQYMEKGKRGVMIFSAIYANDLSALLQKYFGTGPWKWEVSDQIQTPEVIPSPAEVKVSPQNPAAEKPAKEKREINYKKLIQFAVAMGVLAAFYFWFFPFLVTSLTSILPSYINFGFTFLNLAIGTVAVIIWLIQFMINVIFLFIGILMTVELIRYIPGGAKLFLNAEKTLKGFETNKNNYSKAKRYAISALLWFPELIYRFGFQGAYRLLHQAMTGEYAPDIRNIVGSEKNLSYKEARKMGLPFAQAFEYSLSKHSMLTQLILLPVTSTISLLGKRSLLMIYREIGNIIIAGLLAMALLGIANSMGLAAGTSVFWLSDILSWNPLSYINPGWFYATELSGGLLAVALQLFSPFAMVSSYALAFIMEYVNGVGFVRKEAVNKRNSARLVNRFLEEKEFELKGDMPFRLSWAIKSFIMDRKKLDPKIEIPETLDDLFNEKIIIDENNLSAVKDALRRWAIKLAMEDLIKSSNKKLKRGINKILADYSLGRIPMDIGVWADVREALDELGIKDIVPVPEVPSVLKAMKLSFKKAAHHNAKGQEISIWKSAWGTAFHLSGIYFVSFEIEILKTIGALSQPLNQFMVDIEGQQGIMGLGNQTSNMFFYPLGKSPDDILSMVPGTGGLNLPQIESLHFLEQASQSTGSVIQMASDKTNPPQDAQGIKAMDSRWTGEINLTIASLNGQIHSLDNTPQNQQQINALTGEISTLNQLKTMIEQDPNSSSWLSSDTARQAFDICFQNVFISDVSLTTLEHKVYGQNIPKSATDPSTLLLSYLTTQKNSNTGLFASYDVSSAAFIMKASPMTKPLSR